MSPLFPKVDVIMKPGETVEEPLFKAKDVADWYFLKYLEFKQGKTLKGYNIESIRRK